ncbi:acetolactate synthase small subunit [Anaerocolumna aminovalerica]|uniref:acetolactate synthase small subunit n=1 Tax=Anaerocolumna aminovalerica TaxID=1527 RepID=UPI001C0EAEC2|nr:acetolactate synthase small subunit [Anaerocolumna aminovalerica]MBU5331228.1 acetolactate synthase small subunit [Anaerocolumna aminovalerica]
MKKRWISLYVENDVGVLAKISGLFSGKTYNLESLTVGTTEDATVSRITIGLNSDDITFEQIQKQLNRMVEVIKVLDFTTIPTHMKEILFVKIKNCTKQEINEIFQIASVFKASIVDYGADSILLECVRTETKNNDIIKLLTSQFKNVEVVRGGSVAIESISMSDR